MSLSAEDIQYIRRDLQTTTVRCSERCLYQSAKWAAELLSSLPSNADLHLESDTDSDSQMRNSEPLPRTVPIVMTANEDPQEARLESQEIDKYLLAKSFFDCHEYDRCAAVFLPSSLPRGPNPMSSPQAANGRSPSDTKVPSNKGKRPESASIHPANTLPRLSQKALFLALYSKYMSGEKRKDEESEMILGPADGGMTINKELVGIGLALEGWFAERARSANERRNGHDGQGWLEYLYGVVLAKGKNEEHAKVWLLKSAQLQPYLWGAWLELSGLIGSLEELNNISSNLQQTLSRLIFYIYTRQEHYQADDQTLNQLTRLESIFPKSHFLKTQRALLFYHNKDYETAESIFATIMQTDPHRIDALDHYSNILYVMSSRPKLAFLAQLSATTDLFRPETCCVIGNYYSLISQHEKAVLYFRRALTLDRSFLSAWTLMGHEYVEMKNTHAAIESYRRAVDVNRKDYRAWYGLGQTYEILEMHFYALFYFQRAASLRPYDPKMWQAIGSCFSKMGRLDMCVKALKRALVAGSLWNSPGTGSSFGSGGGGGGGSGAMDPETLVQIAGAYEKLGDEGMAREFMELTLAQEEGWADRDDDDDDDEEEDLESDQQRLSVGDGAGGLGGKAGGLGGKEGGGGGLGGKADGGERAGAVVGVGVGVTPTTSRARMWLARWELSHGGLGRAMLLANELCQDGVEVEEAKALIRDVRARMEGRPGAGREEGGRGGRGEEGR